MPKPPIQLKRSGTATATPASLEHGELAINYNVADGKIFWKDSSNVIQSFTFQSYALASHTHAASDVTSGTFDAARLPLATTGAAGAIIVGTGLGVSSGTVSVTYGTTAGTSCQGNDSRLSDTRTPTDGSVTTAKIADDAVTYAKLQNVSATDRILGRSSVGAGDVEEISCGSFGRSLIGSADAAAARTTLSVQPTASPAFTDSFRLTAGNVVFDGIGNCQIFTSTAQASDRGGQLSLGGANGSAGAFDPWAFGVIRGAKENSTSANFAGYLAFGTANAGGTIAERLRINSSGQLLVTAGSASACGVAFSGDANTGIAQIGGADTLSLVASGAERLVVGSSNRTFVNGNGEQYGFGVKYVNTGGPVYFGATSNSATPDAAISNAGGGTMMLLKNDGEVIVGGVTDNGEYNLQCNGTGVWGAGAYVNGSDERIKDDIAPLGEATSAIQAMQPVTFRYKPTWSNDHSIQPGFVAQQLQEALAGTPYLDGVVQQGTQYLSVAYQSLIPLLVKALQESNARIAALEERINA